MAGACYPGSFTDENSTRRRTVSTCELDGKAAQLVLRRWDAFKVEPFYNNHAGAQKRDMSEVMARVELLDRQIVNAHELDPALDNELGTVRCEIGVILMKGGVLREIARVARLEENTLFPLDPLALELAPSDRANVVAELEDQCWSYQGLKRNLVDSLAVVEEVPGRVNVSPGMGPELNGRNVCTSAFGHRLLQGNVNLRITRVNQTPVADRHAYIIDLGHNRAISNCCSAPKRPRLFKMYKRLAATVGTVATLAAVASVLPFHGAGAQSRRVRDEPRPAIYHAADGSWRVDLPPAVEDALDRYNRDFDQWSEENYGRQLSGTDFTPRQTPWAVIGDFNGDGRADVALAGRDDRDALIVLILSSGQRRYRAIEVEHEPYDVEDRRSIRPPLLSYVYPGRYVIDDPRLYYPREILVDQPAVQITGGRRQGAVLYVVERNSVVPYYLSDRPARGATGRSGRGNRSGQPNTGTVRANVRPNMVANVRKEESASALR